MTHEIRFDNTADTTGTTSFQGNPGNYYAEELVVGPNASTKFLRIEDKDAGEIDLSTLGTLDSGYSVRFGTSGVEVESREFDGRKLAQLYRVTYDYNTEEGYIFNGQLDGVTYRTSANPESWQGMTYDEVLTNLVDVQAPGANFQFDIGEFNTATDNSGDKYAGEFSFRNVPLPQAIDQIVKRQGNALWWVEWDGGSNKWRLKFAKRDLSASDLQYAKLSPSADPGLNVIGLELEGPASDQNVTARIFDNGKGYKVQVGGPVWRNGIESVSPGAWQADGSPPPPVRTQLVVAGGIVTNDNIQGACAVAGFAAGIAPTAGIQSVLYEALGYSNLTASISDLTGNGQLGGFTKPFKGYHFIPRTASQDDAVTIEVALPLANTGFPLRWGQGRTVPGSIPGGLTSDFPEKPLQRDGSATDEDWKIDRNLLTHPNQTFTIEVARSRPPSVVRLKYFNVTKPGGNQQYLDYKSAQETGANDQNGKPDSTGDVVAKAYVSDHTYSFGGDNWQAVATVHFYELRWVSVESAKLDTNNSKLIFRTNDFQQFGDWSAPGRDPSAGVNALPTNIAEWVNDDTKYLEASQAKPRLKIFIPLELAFETSKSGGTGSGQWGQQFAFHGVFTLSMPKAISPAGGTTPFYTEQGDYEQHNVEFNGSRQSGYPEPTGTPRNDFDRMQERADIVASQVDPLRNVSGRYQVFPGNKSIQVGQFTNGGMIVKVRHDYVPYFRTQFWLEGTPEIDQLEQQPSQADIGDLRSLIQIGKEKTTTLDRKLTDVAAILGLDSKKETIDAVPGEKGFDLGGIDAGIEIKQSSPDRTDTGVVNEPDVSARGFGEQGPVNMMFAKGTDRFFSDGVVIDTAPESGAFARPANFSSPYVQLDDKQNPVSGGQKLGFAHNYLDLVRTHNSGGVDGGPRYRVCLNVTETDVDPDLLNTQGGDRLNVRDARLETAVLEREGELTSYITNSQFFVTRVSGTSGDKPGVHLGLSRDTENNGVFELQDGAQLGIVNEVGTVKNYAFILDLLLDTDTPRDLAREIDNAEPKFRGIYFGYDLETPDRSEGKNWQYRIRTDEEIEDNPLRVLFDLRQVKTGADQRLEQKTTLANYVTHTIAIEADDLTAPSNYAPKHDFTFDVQRGARKAYMRHELVNPAVDTERRPRFRVDHGNSAVSNNIYFQLTEQSIGPTSDLFPAFGSSETARFEVNAGGNLIVTGNSNDRLIYWSGAGRFAQTRWTDDSKVTFRLDTGLGWKKVGTNLRVESNGGTTTIYLQDSNEDDIDSVSFSGSGGGVAWPPDASMTYGNPAFPAEPTTGLLYNFNDDIYNDRDAYFATKGIFVPGAQPTGTSQPTASTSASCSAICRRALYRSLQP